MSEATLMARRNLDAILLFIFCAGVFTFLIAFVSTDITVHIAHIESINANKNVYPSNFGFYLLINLLSGFSSIKGVEYVNTIMLLSVAAVAKYVISKKIILELNPSTFDENKRNELKIVALALFFCFAIPDPFLVFVLREYYLGRFAPIVWHNSTTILVFPFAILLFWQQLNVLNTSKIASSKEILFLNILVVLNAIIKPSFIFVYAPVTFFFLIAKFKDTKLKVLLLNITPIFTAVLVVFMQTFLIYKLGLGSFQKDKSSIAIGYPFKVLTQWAPMWYLPISLILSFALPIFTLTAYKESLKYRPLLYALSLTIAGLIISALFYETGPRFEHGNFIWQNVICAYLMFLSTLAFLSPKILDTTTWTYKERIVFVLLAMHVLSGLLYLIKIGQTLSYI